MKQKKESWPREMWAVCYENTDYEGGWVPYAGEIYWHRESANARKKLINPQAKVKKFFIGPRGSLNGNEQ